MIPEHPVRRLTCIAAKSIGALFVSAGMLVAVGYIYFVFISSRSCAFIGITLTMDSGERHLSEPRSHFLVCGIVAILMLIGAGLLLWFRSRERRTCRTKGLAISMGAVAFTILVLLQSVIRGGEKLSCEANLREIHRLISTYHQRYNEYPATFGHILWRLGAMNAAPCYFVCPVSGHRSGAPADIDKWSDYVYVLSRDQNEAIGKIAAYCPTANHGGKGGEILFFDGQVKWFSAMEFDAIIRRALGTGIPNNAAQPSGIDKLRR